MPELDEKYFVTLLKKAAELPELKGSPIDDTPKSSYLIETLDGYRIRAYNRNGLGTVELISKNRFNADIFWIMTMNNASDEFESIIGESQIDIKNSKGYVKDKNNELALELYPFKVIIRNPLGASMLDAYLNKPVEESEDFEHG